jgi:predicted membrane-bound spermidine synthase
MTSRVRAVLFGLFLVSGFCGLLYQVVWMRMAFASFGVITPVLSVVISVFMFGLFAGSWAAGRWIERLTGRFRISAVYFYAAAELVIALGAWAVPRLFSAGEAALLSTGESHSTAYLGWSALIIAAAILPWCVLMGTTFPLMTAFVRELDRSNQTSFSFLYLANVIGAMLGTSLTAVVLVELLGFRQTLWVAAACNVLIGVASVILGLQKRTAPLIGAASIHAPVADVPNMDLSPFVVRLLLAILFITGFTSMAMEVVWTRAFTTVLQTQVYSFAVLLFVYLLATWIGSLVYRRHLARGGTLTTAQLAAMLASTSVLPVVMNDPRFHLRWYGALASIFPFCAVLGYLTPKLIDEYSQGRPDRVGSSYAVNVSGCILGPLAASYMLLPAMSLKAVLLVLAAPYLGLLLFYAARGELTGRQIASLPAALGLLAASIIWTRTYEDRWRESAASAIIRRDHTATVISYGEGMKKELLVNGIYITYITSLTKVMAHLPLAHLENRPRSALVICFGMGTTWRSLLSWPIEATAVELVPSVKEAFPFYFDDASTLLAKPNGRIIVDDGRRYLHRTGETFDVITLDPPPPVEAAGSSLLYSDEFYDAVKLRLNENGVLQQWYPGVEGETLQAVTRSLLRSFPHVRMFASYDDVGTHFLASRLPISHLTAEELTDRMPPAAQADLVEWRDDKDATEFLWLILSKERDPRTFVGTGETRITDDRPFNEYYLLRRMRERWIAR